MSYMNTLQLKGFACSSCERRSQIKLRDEIHNFKYPKVFANEVDEPWISKPYFSQCTVLNNPGNNYITIEISPTTM
jgi:hypothetical protein